MLVMSAFLILIMEGKRAFPQTLKSHRQNMQRLIMLAVISTP